MGFQQQQIRMKPALEIYRPPSKYDFKLRKICSTLHLIYSKR